MIRTPRFTAGLCLLIAALFAFAQCLSAQDENEVIKVESATVLINTTVFDRDGKAVGGLARDQFSVFENGTRQEISYFSAADTPFAAVILIDSSGSMESRISMARAAAINFLDGIRESDNVAIYRFASKVELVQDFSGSRDISERIFDIKADGMTALNDSIFKAAEQLKNREEKRRAIVVLSDGEDTFSGRSADRALRAALEAGALIYTIDMSAIEHNSRRRMQNQGVLKNFAEKSGGRFIATPAGAALREAFKTIVEELGVQYTLGYEPIDQKKDGKWRAIEVRIARPNLTIRARKGYTAAR
ncbi:MAG: VWA domain-containing protein [Chloracidobacterium sp.]|nr:VWA domain-containing protein [Chloracidobacterium sp.]